MTDEPARRPLVGAATGEKGNESVRWTHACIDGINKVLGKDALPLPVTEKEFQNAVVALAKRNGWLVWHCTIARKSGAGFPDLVCVRDRLLFIELKTETGRMTAAQQTWIESLKAAGAEAHMFRPSDWPKIEAALA